MPYTQLPLAYEFKSLEPHFDAQTMEIHYTKHHTAYITKLNAAVENTEFANLPIIDLLSKISTLPDSIKATVRNNGGGHYNHTLFWDCLTPNSSTLSDKLLGALQKNFGTLDSFKEQFAAAALNRFGSGWAWLIQNGDALQIVSTANQDSPIMEASLVGTTGTPLLALDVWEHAYYLHYQNRRADYIAAFWNIVDWQKVEARMRG